MTTIPDDHAEAVFSAQRDRLVGVAYRITGSRSDAEDAVQEAWIRWSSAAPGSIDNPPGWLTTVTSRIALDHLRSAQQRREQYVGPWLPDVAGFEPAPDEQAEMAESLTMGFLAVLEHLKPIERAVFVLSDVYGVPYDEIGTVVDRRTDACRQIAHRARQKVRQERPRFAPTDPLAWSVASEFVAALAAGDTDKVLAMLAPDVVHISDGGADHHARATTGRRRRSSRPTPRQPRQGSGRRLGRAAPGERAAWLRHQRRRDDLRHARLLRRRQTHRPHLRRRQSREAHHDHGRPVTLIRSAPPSTGSRRGTPSLPL